VFFFSPVFAHGLNFDSFFLKTAPCIGRVDYPDKLPWRLSQVFPFLFFCLFSSPPPTCFRETTLKAVFSLFARGEHTLVLNQKMYPARPWPPPRHRWYLGLGAVLFPSFSGCPLFLFLRNFLRTTLSNSGVLGYRGHFRRCGFPLSYGVRVFPSA